MKSRMVFKPGTVAVLAAVLGAGCTRPSVPPVTASDVERASARWPGTGHADLDSGRSLFIARCSGCHVTPQPASVVASEWPSHVQEMRERAGLSVDQAALVERYLVIVASRQVATIITR